VQGPEGADARLTKANIDRLVDGAVGAARVSCPEGAVAPELALLISCVGRKLVLKQRIEDEVGGVRDVLGAQAATPTACFCQMSTLTSSYSFLRIQRKQRESYVLPGSSCLEHGIFVNIELAEGVAQRSYND
jgi:hypothetical protein